MSPRELLDLLPRPREVREGRAPHGRHSGPLHGQGVHGGFPLRREEDVDLGWSSSSRPRSTWPDVGRAQGALPVARVVFDPQYCPRSS